MSTRIKTSPEVETPPDTTDALIVEAVERERSRIAMELHDDLGQMLTSSLIVAHQFREMIRDTDPAAAELANQLISINQRMAQASQRLVGKLQPGAALEQSLGLALSNLSAEINQLGFSSSFTGPASLDALDAATALHLFRIAQEAVHNAMKHSGSKQIDICIALIGKDTIKLSVRDAGRGFDVNEKKAGRFGLSNMARHARIAGGELSIRSIQESDFGDASETVVECTIGVPAHSTENL